MTWSSFNFPVAPFPSWYCRGFHSLAVVRSASSSSPEYEALQSMVGLLVVWITEEEGGCSPFTGESLTISDQFFLLCFGFLSFSLKLSSQFLSLPVSSIQSPSVRWVVEGRYLASNLPSKNYADDEEPEATIALPSSAFLLETYFLSFSFLFLSLLFCSCFFCSEGWSEKGGELLTKNCLHLPKIAQTPYGDYFS